MPYKFLGTYKGYNVYKYPYSASARECPSDGNIYLVPIGDGYRMVLNGFPCGYCDSQYCVKEFEEPRSNEVTEFNFHTSPWTFTASSWTTDPDPQVEDKEEPAPQEPPTTEPSDFWTRIQEEIDSTLQSISV